MASVTQITQYLFDSDPRGCLTHLCLYHYLKNAWDPSRSFDQVLINEFIDDALSFEYWQANQVELLKDLGSLIDGLIEKDLLCRETLSFMPETSQQVLFLENDTDFLKLIEEELRDSDLKDFDIVPHTARQKLGLSLLSTGGIKAEVFSPVARIESGSLHLLSPISCLHYNASLDLDPLYPQKLSLNGLQTLHFRKILQQYVGRTVQGHLFKVVSQLETEHFSAYRDGFVALKEIEKHFIEASSDPYYQELVDVLEKAYHLLHSGRVDAPHFAPKALAKGREALQTIYPKDKLLLLLVTNIEYLLRPEQKRVHSPQKPEETMNWQKAKPLPL